MTEQPGQQMTFLDIRHVRRDENVACQAQVCQARWAKYVVECAIDPRSLLRKPVRTYLCHSCMTRLLVMSDALGVA